MMRKELVKRWQYAKRTGKPMYVTEAEHAEIRDEVTPLKKSTVVLYEHVPVDIQATYAARQAKEAK